MDFASAPGSQRLAHGAAPDKLPRWNAVDTVLLDMDGTLLDLRFDNYFWQELVPERFARRNSLTLEAAVATLAPRFAAIQGTLDWYCTDYWSRELGLDIAGLKREVREQVRFLPGATQFLEELRQRGLRTVLVTNAHQDTLTIKAEQTGLLRHFDTAISSHQYGVPKEHPQFWERLQAQLDFAPGRSLFVDDSLPVLRAARHYGVAQIFAISRPDSSQEQRLVAEFPAVAGVIELLGGGEESAAD
ncbi:MAG TPA: GMP/IMP nucleotidase [Steroidobacteraceae bacterium]|jgi:putative hydrolase of the HAD superfamily